MRSWLDAWVLATNRTLLSLVALTFLSSCYESHGLSEPPAPIPVFDGCPAALQSSAPSPVSGYCPTGTNRSGFTLPESEPELRWALEVPGERSVRMVVGHGSRIYMSAEDALIAIDDLGSEGNIAWTTNTGRASASTLLADGSIFVTTLGAENRECIWLASDGEITRRVGMPTGPLGVAVVDAAGHFIFRAGRDEEEHLMALDSECRELWRSEPFNVSWQTAFVSQNGQVIASETISTDGEPEPWVLGFDGETGERIFRTSVGSDTYIQRGPAIGDDGAIHLTLWTDGNTVLTLLILEPNGEERLRVAFPEMPWGGGVPSLSVASDGTTFVKEGEGLMAVDTNGEVLWRLPRHPNINAVATLDAAGRILVGSGAGMAVDALDGTTLWASEIPAHRSG